MKVSKRIITFFLAIAMLVSLFTFASASVSSGILVDSASVASWNAWCSTNETSTDNYWSYANNLISTRYIGSVDSFPALSAIVEYYDYVDSGLFFAFLEVFADLFGTRDYVVMYDSALGVYRPYDNVHHLWFVNSFGHFPYFDPDPDDTSTDDPEEVPVSRTGQWRLKSEVGNQNALWHAISYTELSLLKEQWIDDNPSTWISTENGYSSLVRRDCEDLLTYILCDEKGYPYYMPKDKETAITTPQDYYTDITNQYTDNSTNVSVMDGGNAVVGSPIDVNNGIINVGGQVQYVDQLIYDASTQTYYVDAHDEYVFDVNLNQYVTNNYTYEIQYHIDHTSITYIGQTEEYDERYEMYFQLPDGRSSADLTAEDLEQLSTVFVDVVQYARSADDLSLRGLYHFDGNTDDSSYWSYCTAFDWASGASLTYMDEGTFNGSLYLDETEHDFTIALPSAADLSSDFTIQFRYYQSHTTAPVADSYIQLGSDVVFQFTGSQYLLGSGDALCNTSIGSWNEICIMKSSGTLYYYINGVCCGEVEDNRSHAGTITFYFGDQQQTYKKLDELRISRGAIYTPGADYTPTSVPFDTNLTLILPDGEVPVADEIPVIVPGDGNLLADIGLDNWTDFESVSANINSAFAVTDNYLYRDSGLNIYGHGFQLTASEDCTQLSFSGSFSLADGKIGISRVKQVQNALFLPFRYGNGASYPSWVDDGGSSYCLSVVYPDGAFSYVVFSPGSSSFAVYGDSRIAFVRSEPLYTNAATSTTYRTVGIVFYPPEGSVDIAYMELVKGDAPAFTIDYEQAVYSSGELKESPVLAVRTNRPISGYQIGGVRPSYPQRGLVYAMVENSRITSLQQYTGYAWEQVDGRIWTGERWVPYSSFDVFTLKDYHDIIGGSDPDYEYIYTETGFWAWFQRAWLTLMEKIDQIINFLERIVTGSGAPDEETNKKIHVAVDIITKQKNESGEVSDRISDGDISLISDILDKIRSFFNTGYSVNDMFSFFDDLSSGSWFSPEISSGLDEVNGAAPAGDDDPYNMYYYYDQIDAVKGKRGEGE